MIKQAIKSWRQSIIDISDDSLKNLLAEDVVFHSPVVHTPQKGKKAKRKHHNIW